MARPARSGKAPSQRQLRVGELVRHSLSDMLTRGEVRDPVLQSASVTVTEARMSPDLRVATLFVMPLGGTDAGPVVAALERARGFLRGRIASELDLRFAPELRFAVDTSFTEAQRLDSLLRSPRVARDLAPGGDGKDG
jgi:ribosome-binding factor A